MTLKEHLINNWSLALPVMMSQVGHMMVSFADSVMVGQLGTVPLASVSLSTGIYAVMLLFGIGVSYGMTPIVARADGSDDVYGASTVLKNGLVLNAGIGFGLMLLCFFLSHGFVYLDQEPDVLSGAIPFFIVLGVSTFPVMIFQTFRQFTEGLSMTRQAMIISVAGNLLNILLNYGLIFGELGLPALGMIGAAWATLIARTIMALSMAYYFLYNSDFERFRKVFVEVSIDFSAIRQILKVGVPSGIQFVFEVGAFGTAAIMTGWLGASALAAHQIAINLSAITYMAATGLSAAGTIRISHQLGKKDYYTMQMAGYTSFLTVALLMILCGINFIIGREFYPSLYVDEKDVILAASQLLVIAAFFQLSDGIQSVGLGVLRGLSDVKTPTWVTLIAYWFTAIPLAYILGIYLGYGVEGIWIGLLTGLTISAIAHLIRFHMLTTSLLQESKSITI